MIKFIYQITKEGLPMSQDSLDELFSSNPEFEASCKAISSAVERSINSICVSNIDGISEALALSADCLSRLGDVSNSTLSKAFFPPVLESLGNSINSSSLLASTKVLEKIFKDLPSSTNSSNNFVTLDREVIKEYELPETVAIPVGHNRVKIKFDALLSIIGMIISVFLSLSSSATEQERLTLQRTEVQILSEILENTEPTNSDTAKELDTLKESVDELNSHSTKIEQYLKEIAESEDSDSKSK